MAKEAKVFKIDYEMSESSWKAYVAAFSQEEAVKHLYSMVPGKITRIENTSQHCVLDAVSNPLKNDIAFEFKNKVMQLMEEINNLKKAKDLRTVSKK